MKNFNINIFIVIFLLFAIALVPLPANAGETENIPKNTESLDENEEDEVNIENTNINEDTELTEEEIDDQESSYDIQSNDIQPDEENIIMNVTLPINIDFVIDPFEINGKGQVYSDEYVIHNASETNVRLTFDIGLKFNGDGDFVPMLKPFDDELEESENLSKALYLEMNFTGINVAPMVLTGDSDTLYFDQYLDTDSTFKFGFSGNVNHLSEDSWQNGDIKLELTYELEAAYEEPDDDYSDSSVPAVTPSESPEPSESVEPSESPEPSESVEPSESPEPSESVEPSESPEPSESVEPSESPEPSESVEPSEEPEPSESVEPSELNNSNNLEASELLNSNLEEGESVEN